jgi:hypothetical protein
VTSSPAALDQVGESTENPFEGGANDGPISPGSNTLVSDERVETRWAGERAAVKLRERD